MKNGVSDKTYYFLLEWKDDNLTRFWNLYGRGKRLCDLTSNQLNILYKQITNETT